MDSETLRDQLSKLHAELKSARTVDPQSNQLLGEVLADIKRLMVSHEPVDASSGPPDGTSLTDRLERVAVQFEADHPAVASSSRRLIDLLGKAGL